MNTNNLYWLLLLITCVSLWGCTAAKVPEGKPVKAVKLVQQPLMLANDGAELAVYRWQPTGKVQANLLLLHGFNEYSGSFDQVGKAFAQQGVAVWAFDQRGFGRSPYRGLWSSAERMALDVVNMTELIKRQHPDLPLTVLGMSMGGAVALVAGKDPDLQAEALVLVAPAVWTRSTQPFYQRWALDIAKTLTPGWSPTGQELQIRPSDNIPMLRTIWQSPWMIRKSRMDTVAGLVDLMDKGFAAAENISLPALLLYGAKDELVPKKPISLLWSRLPKMGNTRRIDYPNGWHMLMRDLQGQKVINDIVQWMPKK